MYLVSDDLNGIAYGFSFLRGVIKKTDQLVVDPPTWDDEFFLQRMLPSLSAQLDHSIWEIASIAKIRWRGTPRTTPIEWKDFSSYPPDELFNLMSGIEIFKPAKIHYIIYFANHNALTNKTSANSENNWYGDFRIETLGGQFTELFGGNEIYRFLVLSRVPLDRWFTMGANQHDAQLFRTRITLEEVFVHELDHMTRPAFGLADQCTAERYANSAVNAMRRYQGRRSLIQENTESLRYDIYPTTWSARKEESKQFIAACWNRYPLYSLPIWDSLAFPGVSARHRLPPAIYCPQAWLNVERAWRSWQVACEVAMGA